MQLRSYKGFSLSILKPRTAKTSRGSANATSHRDCEVWSPLKDGAWPPRPPPLDLARPPDGMVVDEFIIIGATEPSRTRYFPGISDRNSEISRSEFDYFPQLDGFRGLAASLVVLGHLILFRDGSDAIASLGVMLFFVLSGFLITGLLVNERVRYGRIDLRAFYLRRVLRLAPALACFLLAVMILIRLGLIVDVPRYELIACIFYFRNIVGRSTSLAHLWSLSLEEQFYGLWPLLIGRVKSARRMLIYAAILTGIDFDCADDRDRIPTLRLQCRYHLHAALVPFRFDPRRLLYCACASAR